MTRAHVAEWAEHPDLVEWYIDHRADPEELYPSERRFLPWLASESASVLDVGCAAGGFASIWRHWSPDVAYTGVDVSEPLVEAARRLHPDHAFELADCAEGLPFAGAQFDAVQALGWLHWEPRFEDALAELWRVTARRLFFDVRLRIDSGEHLRAEQRIALGHEWDGHTTVPYLCLAWERFAATLLELAPGAILAQGYEGRPSDTVSGVQGEICFATFVLDRGASPGAAPLVCTALPGGWPSSLAGGVDLRDPAELSVHAPVEVPVS
jgi:SAM-dependent methyltransferase